MTPFLPGYEPGTWVEIVSAPEMLCSLQYDYGPTFTLTDSLPYEPILGKQGKIVAILGTSGLLRLYFPHNDSYHIIQLKLVMLSKSSPKKKFIPVLRMTAAILFLPFPVTACTILFTEINFLFAVVRLSLLAFPKAV